MQSFFHDGKVALQQIQQSGFHIWTQAKPGKNVTRHFDRLTFSTGAADDEGDIEHARTIDPNIPAFKTDPPIFGFARALASRYAPQMERNDEATNLSFGNRLALGFKVIFNATFAAQVVSALKAGQAKPSTPSAEQVHASSLLLLSSLQREGRLVDFLQQDVASFSDEEVGAAARVVHAGSRKLLHQYFDLEPAAKQNEGAEVTVPKGFDAQRWRLTGNVAGQPPFRGTLRHHGWVARQVRMPAVAESLDPRIIAPAEVELT